MNPRCSKPSETDAFGRVEQALELSANIFLRNLPIRPRQHSGIFHRASPSVRFCLLSTGTASDGGRRKLTAAGELSVRTPARSKSKRFG